MRKNSLPAITVLTLGLAACVSTPRTAAPSSGPSDQHQQQGGSPVAAAGKKAGDILIQPARDVGIGTKDIPPALEAAAKDPYNLAGLKTCKQLAAALKDLNEALGPDFVVNSGKRENMAGKFAEAGGRAVVNTLIPFRGLVREISGAAPAQRRLNAAVDAGYARRGFLRGIHHSRRCRTP